MDVHKYAHHAVALNCLGQELSQLSFTNDELAHCRTWLNGLGAKPAIVVGLEDVNGVGTRLIDRSCLSADRREGYCCGRFGGVFKR